MKAITFQGNDLIPRGVVNWLNESPAWFTSEYKAGSPEYYIIKREEWLRLRSNQQALASAVPFDREEDIKFIRGLQNLPIRPFTNTPYFLDLEWHVEEVKCLYCEGIGEIENPVHAYNCPYCQGTGKRKIARLDGEKKELYRCDCPEWGNSASTTIGNCPHCHKPLKPMSEPRLDGEKKDKPPQERILCAAIWYPDWKPTAPHLPKNVDSGVVLFGKNHAQIIGQCYSLTGRKQFQMGNSEQGFLTNTNYFVGRKEAFKIALSVNQIIPVDNYEGKELYSEDLI